MRALTLFVLFAVYVTVSSCAAPSRSAIALKHIDAAVYAYGEAHPRKRYSQTFRELVAFAAARGKPLDLSPFTSITLERRSSRFMSIDYRTHDPSLVYGSLVYSAIECPL
jgi:hypothetical protein